jgi:Uma2 family endonuclease
MATEPKPRFTPEEYLALERQSELRNEYLHGEIFAMTGASEKHNLITLNIAAGLHGQLKKRDCKTYSNDMRVKVPATGLYTYPDVAVVCGEAQFEDDSFDTLLNPVLIVEVLSKSTSRYDRIEKFAHYRSIPSFAEYLIVWQDEYRVEHNARQRDGRWLLTDIRGRDEQVALQSVGCALTLEDIYDRVSFD